MGEIFLNCLFINMWQTMKTRKHWEKILFGIYLGGGWCIVKHLKNLHLKWQCFALLFERSSLSESFFGYGASHPCLLQHVATWWERLPCARGRLCNKSSFFLYSSESVVECPRNCHGNGECVSGTCHCFPGFLGPDCSRGMPVRCFS